MLICQQRHSAQVVPSRDGCHDNWRSARGRGRQPHHADVQPLRAGVCLFSSQSVMALFLVAASVIRSSYGVLQWQTSRARRASRDRCKRSAQRSRAPPFSLRLHSEIPVLPNSVRQPSLGSSLSVYKFLVGWGSPTTWPMQRSIRSFIWMDSLLLRPPWR